MWISGGGQQEFRQLDSLLFMPTIIQKKKRYLYRLAIHSECKELFFFFYFRKEKKLAERERESLVLSLYKLTPFVKPPEGLRLGFFCERSSRLYLNEKKNPHQPAKQSVGSRPFTRADVFFI
jgi:hypothetical protein